MAVTYFDEREFERRFSPEDTFVQPEQPRDIVQTLESAGFVPAASQGDVLDLVKPTSVAPRPAPASTAAGQPPTDPRDLITYLNKTDPNFAQTALDKYKADYAAASAAAEGSFDKPLVTGTDVGGWNITPFETYRPDPSGFDIPDRQVTEGDKILGGYNATKTTIGETGKPIETTFTYDANGAITGSTQRIFTGGDSGYFVERDATGNIIRAREFDYDRDSLKALMPVAQIALAAFAPGLTEFFTPAASSTLGTTLGTAGSKALGAAATGAIGGGTMAGLAGQDVLKGALIGGATGALGSGAGELLGKKAGEFVSTAFESSPELASVARDVASGAVTGAAKALPGAVATGDYGSIGIGALTGAGGKAIGNMLGDTASEMGINLTQKQLDTGINLVRAVQSGNTTAMINYAAQLTGSRDANIAAKAYTTLKAFQSGNPFAATAAFMQLGQAVGGSKAVPKTSVGTQIASAGPGDFETRSIIDPMGDMGGTLVPGEAGEDVDPNRVVVAGQNEPVDLLSMLDIDTSSTGLSTKRADQKVEVEAPRSREDIALDYFFYPDDLGEYTGPAGQKVDVLGNVLKDDATDVISLFDKDLADQVEVVGKKIPKDDITDQSVSVTGTKLPPDEKTTPATTPAVTPAVKPAITIPTATPRQQLAMPQQDMSYITELPLYKSVFYEKMRERERQEELARALQEQENADPYERLMALAERNPDMAVDELMKIVEGDRNV